MKSNYLITGGTGLIGKRVVSFLTSKQENQVYALTRNSKIKNEFKNVNYIEKDLSRFNTSTLPEEIDTIIHLAQSENFRQFPEMAEDVFNINIQSLLLLLQWAVQNKIQKFILVSSGGIYGTKINRVLKEDDLLAVDSPLGFYLGTKLCSEIIFQNYMHFFETAIIIRPFFVYGEGQRKDMFVQRIIESVKNGTPIRLQGKEGLRINPIYVNDIASSIVKSLDIKGKSIYNIGGTEIISLKEMANTIGKILGKEPVFEYVEGEPSDYIANIEKAKKELDLNPISLEHGLKKVILGGT
jgi:nucleoside-diphosphate-sugar epimerase